MAKLDWYSLESELDAERFANAWGGSDAPLDELGAMLLDIAKTQVIAYAPAIEDCDPSDPLCPYYTVTVIDGVVGADGEDGEDVLSIDAPKPRLVFAQLQQAKNLWNAGRANPAGDVGAGEFSYTPRPLDKTIREMIRPKRGTPNV